MSPPSSLSSPSTTEMRKSPLGTDDSSSPYSSPAEQRSAPTSQQHQHQHQHQHKLAIKPALKNSRNWSPNNSLPSTPTSNRPCSFSTPSPSPSSSSFSRRHHNKLRNHRCSGSNGEGSGGSGGGSAGAGAGGCHDDDDDDDDTWRKDGKEWRSKLLEDDDATGGSEFVINRQCKLKNYCAIADRVSNLLSVVDDN